MFSENLENQIYISRIWSKRFGSGKSKWGKKKKKTQDELPKQKKVNSMAFLS